MEKSQRLHETKEAVDLMEKLKRRINGDRTVFVDLDKAFQQSSAGAPKAKSAGATQSQPQEPPNYSKEDVSDRRITHISQGCFDSDS